MLYSDKFKSQILAYKEILAKFNAVHDLTKHENLDWAIEDSFKGYEFVEGSPKIAIDIGSGAGFPGVFLSFILNECEWHLFEPNFKRSSFLTYVKLNLGLKNVIIHSEKLENSTKFRADLITSRAVMKTTRIIEISNGFYDENTQFLLYKGSSVENELVGLKAKIYKNNNRNFVSLKGVKNG